MVLWMVGFLGCGLEVKEGEDIYIYMYIHIQMCIYISGVSLVLSLSSLSSHQKGSTVDNYVFLLLPLYIYIYI